jgi:uncharacterized membrane protein
MGFLPDPLHPALAHFPVALMAYQGHLGGELVFHHGVGTAPVQRQPAR